jgi:Oxidoreductase FAD-binding domain
VCSRSTSIAQQCLFEPLCIARFYRLHCVFCLTQICNCVLQVGCSFDKQQWRPKDSGCTQSRQFQPFILRETADLSSNTRRFRFALQSDSEQPKVLGLPCGYYVAMQFEDTGANTITRYYTPTSGNDEVSSPTILLFSCACCSFTCSRCVAILQPHSIFILVH